MKVRYKITLFILILMITSLTLLGVSYSFSPKNLENENSALVVTNEELSINYFTSDTIIDKILKPNEEIMIDFSVTNGSEKDMYYSFGLDEVLNIIDGEVVINLTSTNNGGTINNGNYPKEANVLINQIKIPANTIQSYTLSIKNISNNIGEIGGKIKIEKVNYVEDNSEETKKTFANILLENNPIKSALTIPGKEKSTTDEGLIMAEDDYGNTYYFRGKVENNYVSFSGYTWRIIRINGDGSVRLILDNILDETTIYNTINENNITESYNFNNSTIKTLLDSWYETNLKDNDIKISENAFCNDYQNPTIDGYNEIYQNYNNIKNEIITFKCTNSITAKIGLINVMEAIYAGSYSNYANTNNYLYNAKIKSGWWTMSPSYYNTNNNELYMYSLNAGVNNIIDSTVITSEKGLRPVINLSKNVTVTGTGSISDPYIVQ